jgi:hypothetical protein
MKTLITHARDEKAKFLGYEVHILHENSKHDLRGRRCINGSVGLRIPREVRQAKCSTYKRRGKPVQLPQRTIDDAYSIVAQYQAEYRGIVQYYRMAYNLHTLHTLKWIMEVSLVRTLANKYRTTCTKIYQRYGTMIQTGEGTYKVLQVTVKRPPPKKALTAYFGGVSLKSNKWVGINDQPTKPHWSRQSEVVQRLLAQECELCGSDQQIKVHHIRKLADLNPKDGSELPEWTRRMAARRRTTLVGCRACHESIQ